MKNILKFLTIAGLVLAVTLAFAACGDTGSTSAIPLPAKESDPPQPTKIDTTLLTGSFGIPEDRAIRDIDDPGERWILFEGDYTSFKGVDAEGYPFAFGAGGAPALSAYSTGAGAWVATINDDVLGLTNGGKYGVFAFQIVEDDEDIINLAVTEYDVSLKDKGIFAYTAITATESIKAVGTASSPAVIVLYLDFGTDTVQSGNTADLLFKGEKAAISTTALKLAVGEDRGAVTGYTISSSATGAEIQWLGGKLFVITGIADANTITIARVADVTI